MCRIEELIKQDVYLTISTILTFFVYFNFFRHCLPIIIKSERIIYNLNINKSLMTLNRNIGKKGEWI